MHYKSNFGTMPRAVGGIMEDIFNNGWNRVFFDDNRDYSSVPVNVKETENAYEVQLIAPGLTKEDFKISLDKNVLNISYDKKEEAKDEKNKWIRAEYRFHSFKRSFTLNEKIDQNGINAKYENGILNISLPKKEAVEANTKDITVG